MRRSKSNPARYVKNYNKLSQRRMIDADDSCGATSVPPTNDVSLPTEADSTAMDATPAPATIATNTEMLSTDLLEEYGGDEVAILPSKKKRSPATTGPTVELTPAELKQAAAERKKQARKLQQLADRAAVTERRSGLYASLQQTKVSDETSRLLHSTAHWGKTLSNKERVAQAQRRQRAGLTLTEEEDELLHKDPPKRRGGMPNIEASMPEWGHETTMDEADQTTKRPLKKLKRLDETNDQSVEMTSTNDAQCPQHELPDADATQPSSSAQAAPPSGRFVATQMLASLISLQKKSVTSVPNVSESSNKPSAADSSSTPIPPPKYVPSNPVTIQTTQSYDIPLPTVDTMTTQQVASMIRSIQRPDAVTATRLDLPVAAMEFDIVDAVRNHDVTIVCAATGSGKSTQVPQFLYEAGQSLSTTHDALAPSPSYLVGVTQPRRVAAVSTAKRVCYELGFGSGLSISSNNVVAYQTRHETAGLGTKTCIKFMTDGILLQEIQSDLLLRKYSAIVLDEAHERNLNTDVLLGLLSAALPLRRAASLEDPTLPPLKVVIMSATLRVKDFTENPRLFASPMSTTVVNVPGRTFPVTIHHSKVTELDNYEEAAFQKACKIHRKLPDGGILLFLTGKQEIIRMVNRLRRALQTKEETESTMLVDQSATTDPNADASTDIVRDMDDDEADGDIFQLSHEPDDCDESEKLRNDDSGEDSKDALVLKAIVRPLYSLLSTEEQAQIFAPVPEGCRLIVVATNIAETSITIPGISYVVDPGRQKCRNYHAETGVASYDIMWISKAAADQRAGRAGRTGPGHCYRIYSSSLYSRHMDQFALPEVLTRPLEDIVLAMKAMKVSNVANFPFPTPPDRGQVDAAAKLLANLGCVDLTKVDEVGGDGEITRLGMAVSKLPLGVRYSKILLVAAEAGVLDYAISIVAALSESNPFVSGGQSKLDNDDEAVEDRDMDFEDEQENKKAKPLRWSHKSGDLLAAMLAVGAYAFAGCDGNKRAGQQFCETNGLHPVIMERIQKLRSHLARLSKTRLGSADGVAASTGGFLKSMGPPNKLHEILLCQSIASGFLDNIAFLAPLGSIPGQHPFSLRSAYLSCSSTLKEPLFMDRNSVVYSRDARQLPKWICFESLLRKTLKDGTPIAVMKNVTPIDPSWLGRLADGSRLLKIGEPIPSPPPVYDPNRDTVLCSVKTLYGSHAWEVPPARRVMFDALHSQGLKQTSAYMLDDSFRWFGRFLFEGEVFADLKGMKSMLNDDPSIVTRKSPSAKVALLVSALAGAGVDSAAALRKHWAEVNDKFLFSILKRWTKQDEAKEMKQLWVTCVKAQVRVWKARDI